MRYIIIGLGNFGSTLAIQLTSLGHEVIGVDKDMAKVNSYKDKITHTVALDSGDVYAVSSLPLKDTDAVIVAIGEDFGASVLTTALMKQLKVKRLIGRAINDLHQTVIEAIGVDEVIKPEQDSAERLAIRLNAQGIIDLFPISSTYSMVEVELPERFAGKTVAEVKLRETYNINILTILRNITYTNLIGNKHVKKEVVGVVTPSTKLMKNDILVLFGKIEDINRLIE
ncbi:MAG TPA: TrkA family potassium uptake protein [Cytophagaceae bacterium]